MVPDGSRTVPIADAEMKVTDSGGRYRTRTDDLLVVNQLL
jgi:hypothetical protein